MKWGVHERTEISVPDAELLFELVIVFIPTRLRIVIVVKGQLIDPHLSIIHIGIIHDTRHVTNELASMAKRHGVHGFSGSGAKASRVSV
jgi:hypothetical protein